MSNLQFCPGCCKRVPVSAMQIKTSPYETQNLLICKRCMVAEQRGAKRRERQS